MIRANLDELEKINSNTSINGLKLILNCSVCGRKWSIWFRDESDLLNNLPNDWNRCLTCNKSKIY